MAQRNCYVCDDNTNAHWRRYVKKVLAMVAAGIVIGAMGLWVIAGYVPVHGIETPKYAVSAKRDGYELRRYAPHILAEAAEKGAYRETQNRGFREVAAYIFGANKAKASISMTAPVLHTPETQSQKIAMTAPVMHEKAAEPGVYKLAFVMPSSYSMDTLPVPDNPNVTLRQVPEKTYAAVKFRGFARESTVARKTQQLLERLQKDGVAAAGAPVLAQYNPPWTPPFMRRNEILVEVNQ